MLNPPDLSLLPSPILVTGASGFVGEKLTRRLVELGCPRVIGTSFSKSVDVAKASIIPVDLRDAKAVDRLFRDLRPGLIFHCAALTDPAFCEQEPQSAEAGIVSVAENLIASRNNYKPEATMIALSTDMVFNGLRGGYTETDLPCPVSVYGRCKAKADALFLAHQNVRVFRPALIYGEPSTHRGSFLAWMIQAIAEGRPLRLFSDEYRTPLYVGDLVELMLRASEYAGPERLFHVGGASRISRVEMGMQLCRALGCSPELIESVTLEQAGLKTSRPADVSLVSTLAEQTFSYQSRSFEAGVRLILENIA